ADAGQRDLEVLVDVDRQGSQGGHVDHLGQPGTGGADVFGRSLVPSVGGRLIVPPIGGRLIVPPIGGVDGHEEPGEGLPGAGGGGHQDVLAGGDERPGGDLGSGGPSGEA